MKYALVDNNKTEAAKGLKGVCRICGEPVIPKCGPVKINHWAHKSCTHCDKWWENETEWHRNWKDLFPKEWQEVVAFDEKTGEKHIADIKTNSGMVIEFQHSYIKEEERLSREKFYKNMIWVADGTRRKTDYSNFQCVLEYGILWYIPNTVIFVIEHGLAYFPREWQHCNYPVLFDFKGLIDPKKICNYDQRRDPLWCLLPLRDARRGLAVMMMLYRDSFVQYVNDGGFTFKFKEIANTIDEAIKNRMIRHARISRKLDVYF